MPSRSPASPYLATLIISLIANLVSAQHGPYKYCCDIQKCQNVTRVCSSIPSCAASCLDPETTTFPTTCTPEWALPKQNYTCFSKYMTSNISLIHQKCGQSYSPGLAPAPNAFITFGECTETCSGWDLAPLSTSTGPIALLMQYIAPVVAFSVTVPRRRRWDGPNCLSEFNQFNILTVLKLLLSSAFGCLVVFVDVVVWIFTIFVAAGPILVGGIQEMVLDYQILRQVRRQSGPGGQKNLTRDQRIELLAVILCGNLDRAVGDPSEKIGELLRGPESDLQKTQARLAAILRSQGTFGSLVGAPVLFFVGSSVVNLDSLSKNIGDNSTGLSLAFGMWWMVGLPVAVVSSCILANNNPSVVSGLLGEYEQGRKHVGRLWWLRMSPMYEGSFIAVTLWDRGRMKKSWLEETSAWNETNWLREEFQERLWIPLAVVPSIAFLLALIPTLLAGLISYTTPKVCVSCRSLTFLVYITSQLILIVFNTWRTNRPSECGSTWERILAACQQTQHPVTLAGAVLAGITLVFAGFGSLFTAFAGTILQLLGVYGNCYCSIPIGTWSSPDRDMQLINLATDTLLHREMSNYWSAAGYIAVGFTLLITYVGWLCQSVLRRQVETEVQRLEV